MWAIHGKQKIVDKRWTQHPVKMIMNMIKNTCFTDEKRHRVYVQNVPVCTGTTRTHVSTCVRVVPVHTGTFWTYTRGRVEWTHGGFSVPHTTHTHINTHNTTQHNTLRPQHHTTTERDRERETETETDRDRDRERDRDRQRQREQRREKIHFQCGGAWPFFFFVDVVICLVNPVCARDLSLPNSVQ